MRKPRSKKTADWSGLLSDSTHDVRRLSSVIRFSSIPVTYAESTAEHSFYVALYALMIYREIPSTGTVSQELDVLRHALSHDLGECVAGDVVRTLKYSTPEMKREVDRAEGILMEKLLPARILGLALEDPSPFVRDVVKAADYMSLFHFMRREAARRNLEIYPYYRRMVRDLEAAVKKAPVHLGDLYSEMVSESKAVARDCFPPMTAPGAHKRWYREI